MLLLFDFCDPIRRLAPGPDGRVFFHFLPLQVGSESWLLAPMIVWIFAVACIFVFSRPGNTGAISAATTERIRILGLMTYPLYLVHHTVGIAVERYLISTGIDKWLALILSVASMIAVSWIVCKKCEPWIRKALTGTKINRPVLQN